MGMYDILHTKWEDVVSSSSEAHDDDDDGVCVCVCVLTVMVHRKVAANFCSQTLWGLLYRFIHMVLTV